MCDGVMDCSDGSDEFHDSCEFQTTKIRCERRFDLGEILPIPFPWVMDNVEDCIGGKDEQGSLWSFCGNHIEKTYRVKADDEICYNVFLCRGEYKQNYVYLDNLCDGLESCGNDTENNVCRIARDFPKIQKTALYQGFTRSFCYQTPCELTEFRKPWGDVFFEQKMKIYVPSSKIDCSSMFGENYLTLSCMNLCLNSTCPLTGRELLHDSCPGQYPDRVTTLANHSFLTFLHRSEQRRYQQNYFQCNNNKCIDYTEVCDLVDHCGDMSDELNCTNHIICEDTLNSTNHQFISLSQKCDGIYDCFDLSDECNDVCGKQIVEHWLAQSLVWIIGMLALTLNGFITVKHIRTLNDYHDSRNLFITKVLFSVIGSADFLTGLYLILLSTFNTVVYKSSFCRHQAEWLTGSICAILGIISTVGSQLSLFAMTALSLIRMYGIKNMNARSHLTNKELQKLTAMVFGIVVISVATAVAPLISIFEDYFVQGIYYGNGKIYRLFIGFPNKVRHIEVLRAYYNTTNITTDLTWREISDKVDSMFSQQYESLSRRPVHFYGNDGVCLFKYFVRSDDARRSRIPVDSGAQITDKKGDAVVWSMLVINFICFIIISYCYLDIYMMNKNSANDSGQDENPDRRKEARILQYKVTLIIMTDFLCWIPFIIICTMHNAGGIDATKWYVNLALIVLPINSVINPLIVDSAIRVYFKNILYAMNISIK
jgi:hypothetical protein